MDFKNFLLRGTWYIHPPTYLSIYVGCYWSMMLKPAGRSALRKKNELNRKKPWAFMHKS